MKEKVFVTGAAGFIGSNLVDSLLVEGFNVVGWDNFSTGRDRFLENATCDFRFNLIQGDTLDFPSLREAMKECDFVYHLAANADVRFGTAHPRFDLEQNTIATQNVLEAMRANGISRIAFSSTGSIYGDTSVIPTPENAPFPVQTSLYGASKLAAEALISSYCEGFGFQGYVFRFVSILGERYNHGHVFDFSRQLREHPDHLVILGDGNQTKSYLYIDDCIQGLLLPLKSPALFSYGIFHLFNLGTLEAISVSESARIISSTLGLTPEFRFSGGKRGWVGDNPLILLDTTRIRSLGWSPSISITEALAKTTKWISTNSWIFEQRHP